MPEFEFEPIPENSVVSSEASAKDEEKKSDVDEFLSGLQLLGWIICGGVVAFFLVMKFIGV